MAFAIIFLWHEIRTKANITFWKSTVFIYMKCKCWPCLFTCFELNSNVKITIATHVIFKFKIYLQEGALQQLIATSRKGTVFSYWSFFSPSFCISLILMLLYNRQKQVNFTESYCCWNSHVHCHVSSVFNSFHSWWPSFHFISIWPSFKEIRYKVTRAADMSLRAVKLLYWHWPNFLTLVTQIPKTENLTKK